LEKNIAFINENPFSLKNDAAAAFVHAVVEKQGGVVTFEEMEGSYPALQAGRSTRIYKALPAEISARIGKARGKGFWLIF
jgi:hypothetical protein